eukprot:scaffold76350_cov60-Phaeocystis_antarctica.AAC.3
MAGSKPRNPMAGRRAGELESRAWRGGRPLNRLDVQEASSFAELAQRNRTPLQPGTTRGTSHPSPLVSAAIIAQHDLTT